MRTSAQLRGAATAWGALSLTGLVFALATFPYGLLRSYSDERAEPEPYISAPPVNAPVEAPPAPERVAGVASPASQTEIWFSSSRRLVRLGGIYPVRPDDPNFLANNQYVYGQVLSGEIECVERTDGETFRCQNTKGEDIAALLVRHGLASRREIAPVTAGTEEPLDSVAPQAAPGDVGLLEARDVRWRRRPDERDFERHYPRAALEASLSGRVVLDCLIQDGGALSCSVAEEEPTGAGFAEAAHQLSREFRAGSRTEDGQRSAGRRVRLALAFRPGE